MKQLLFALILCVHVGVFAQQIPPVPSPPRLVNDFVGTVLNAQEIDALERKLVAYNDSTSTDITVVIVKTVEPYDIADYALEIGRKWKLGKVGKNNGIVLVWAVKDRKIGIQTGNGMEGVLPDMYAKKIIREIIGPNFKQMRYYEGLDQGTTQIFKYANGEYKAEPETTPEIGLTEIIFFILIILFFLWIFSRINRGGGGGRGLRDSSGWPYTTYTGWGRQSGNWGGGSSWGGGFGGGGGGGGGFGGFGGGGGFSGGGASGDY